MPFSRAARRRVRMHGTLHLRPLRAPSQFWQNVRKLARLAKTIPAERRTLSGVRAAVRADRPDGWPDY